jgi:anionic cell wall polymer biosynthesis LytR-Cps2A-Psr (LCP) family protein
VRNKNTDFSILLLIGIIIVVVMLAGGLVYYTLSGNSALVSDTEDLVVNTLFVFEHDNKPLCSYIVLYYPKTNRGALFNIPGDIGRILKKINRVDRIDALYDGNNPDSFINEIEDLLALDINYSIIFDLPSLEKMVDILDGVSILIPRAIEVFDGKDSILFPSGRIVLDGDKAREYILYGSRENDNASAIESLAQRQERFFVGFLKKLQEKINYIKKPEVNMRISALMRTNMNQRVRLKLFDELSKIDTDRIVLQSVGGNYREVSGKQLLFPFYDASLVKDIVRQTLASLTREGAFSSNGRVITVEVLNGTGVAGLAGRTAELIRVFGYDVIKTANAEHNDYPKTTIIDHINQTEEVKSFADIIHCENIITDSRQDNYENDPQNYEYKADFTLIIGKDFNGRRTRN